MATPVAGTLTFVGRSGRTYIISMYTADTAGYINKFAADTIATATSASYWRPPENVTLTDFSITTGTTQVALVMMVDGAVKNGTVMSTVHHVSTAPFRPVLRIQFPAGSLIGQKTI